MAFYKLRSIPGNEWPAVPDSVFSLTWSAYLELDRIQWLSPEEIECRQMQQVRTLLAHCITHVPYYRRIWPEMGIVPGAIRTMVDFRKIPFLPRKICQERHEDLRSTSLPLGTNPTGVASTSGSSGIPIRVLQTERTDLWWKACYLRDLEWSDLDPTKTMAIIIATGKTGNELKHLLEGIALPSWQIHLQGLIESGPAYIMDIRQDPRRQLDWIRGINPDYLLTYAGNLEVLASFNEGDGRPIPNLRAIQSMSEPLSPKAKHRVETAFDVPVKNLYSCSEGGYLASPCPSGHGWHVHAENVLLEVLDDSDQPCRPGQTGRAVLTNLHNLRSPFVRYELGDRLTRGPDRCPCGRGLSLLTEIQGKLRPMFRLSGGRLKSSSGVADILTDEIGSHRQHQVTQKALDHVVVRLIPDKTWTNEHGEKLRRLLREFFETPIRIDLLLQERLELSASGKFQSMVCEVGPR